MTTEISGVLYCSCRRCRRDREARRERERLERHYGVAFELLGVTRTVGVRFAVFRLPAPEGRTLHGFKEISPAAHPQLDVGPWLRAHFDELKRAARAPHFGASLRAHVAAAEILLTAPGGQA